MWRGADSAKLVSGFQLEADKKLTIDKGSIPHGPDILIILLSRVGSLSHTLTKADIMISMDIDPAADPRRTDAKETPSHRTETRNSLVYAIVPHDTEHRTRTTCLQTRRRHCDLLDIYVWFVEEHKGGP